jgi:RNA-directed DNA polymerase
VAYADDFVNVSRGHAADSLAWTKVVMGKLGLTVNEAKTSVRDLTVLLGSEVPESS